MRFVLSILLCLLALPAAAQGLNLSGGATLLDGRQQPVVVGDIRGERLMATAGVLPDEGTGWAGGGYLLHLGDVDLSLGAVLVSDDTRRISEGPNFHVALHTDLDRFTLSLRHISNGAQTFGHDNYPNSGENMLLVGWRF